MVVITHNNSTNASNVVISSTSNGTAPSTPAELATKLHLGMHHKHVEDVSMMMEFVVITILRESTMEILLESAD
jgi:hypothetical protein